MPANWPPTSHFSCLFQGIVDAPRSSGSSTRRAWVLSDAQDTIKAVLASKSARASFRIRSNATARINYSVYRLHLDAARQGVCSYIADTGGGFKRRHAKFTNASAAGVHAAA